MLFGRKGEEDDTVIAVLASAIRRDISFGVLRPDQPARLPRRFRTEDDLRDVLPMRMQGETLGLARSPSRDATRARARLPEEMIADLGV